MQPNTAPLTEHDFITKYWFSPEQLVTVRNPLSVNFDFNVENRRYQVPANGTQRLSGFISNVYLDQISKMIAQDENKLQFMVDPELKAQYYDRLLVSVEDIVPQFVEEKSYLNQNQPSAWQTASAPFQHLQQPEAVQAPVAPVQAPQPVITPQAEAAYVAVASEEAIAPIVPEQAPEVIAEPAPVATPAPVAAPVAAAPAPEDKQFTLGDATFTLTHVDGQPTYAKNGVAIDDNDFYRAASLL